MYCVKCGVELADSEEICPLCKTTVYHPVVKQLKTDPPYPKYVTPSGETFSMLGVLFIVTAMFLLPIILTVVCDLTINGNVTWSGYAAGALITAYTVTVLPSWFKKPNPAIFVPVGFSSIAIYLLYISIATNGKWFLPFALPTVVCLCLIITAFSTLKHYLKRGHLYIFGGTFIALAAFSILLEFLLNNTFKIRNVFVWSYYPCIALFIIGMLLIIIAICRPIRESLKKKFFI